MSDLSESTSIGTNVPPLTHTSDDELVAAARLQDNSAIEALMRRYNRRLFRVARSILRDAGVAEDAVQECYVSAFTKLDRYRPTGAFSAWLTRIVINEALMLKRRTRHTFVSLDDLEEEHYDELHSHGDELSTPDAVQATSARQLLELAIDQLPQPFRMVFMMRIVEQLSVAETAACLDLNEATVKTRLHRAHIRLRKDISRRLEREHLSLFDFGGETCDRIVARVFARLRGFAAAAHPLLL